MGRAKKGEKKAEEVMAVIAMIPGRIGSTRLPMKNLALLGGRPLLSYAVRAAKAAGVFDRIIVNGDQCDLLFVCFAHCLMAVPNRGQPLIC